MRFLCLSILAAILICVSVTGVALAGEQLDQSYVAAAESNLAAMGETYVTQEMSQTFTVGLSGYLSRVDVGVDRERDFRDAGLTVDISRTINGVTDFSDAGILASRTFPPEQIHVLLDSEYFAPTLNLSINFLDEHIKVSPGDVLAIRMSSKTIDRDGYTWWATVWPYSDTYPRGAMYVKQYPNGVLAIADWSNYGDLQFRTFVDTPEPSAFLLSAVALGAVSLRRQRLN